MFEPASTPRATLPGHRHLNDRFCEVIGGGRLSVAEPALARPSARTLGLCGSLALGEWSGLALSASLSLNEALLQLPDRHQLPSVPILQPHNFNLLAVNLSNEVAMLAGWDVFV